MYIVAIELIRYYSQEFPKTKAQTSTPLLVYKTHNNKDKHHQAQQNTATLTCKTNQPLRLPKHTPLTLFI